MAIAAEKQKKIFTYKDYDALPEGAPYELIEGELVMTPSPAPFHQIILSRIMYELMTFARERDAGLVLSAPIDVHLSETNTFQPDIIFIAKERLSIIGEKKIEGAPDLVIEILSPANAYYDLRTKKDVYEQSGVREYWIVDPIQKSIEIYVNKESRFELAASRRTEGEISSAVLQGFGVSLERLFG